LDFLEAGTRGCQQSLHNRSTQRFIEELNFERMRRTESVGFSGHVGNIGVAKLLDPTPTCTESDESKGKVPCHISHLVARDARQNPQDWRCLVHCDL